MNRESPSTRHWTADLRPGLIIAVLMIVIALGTKLATRFGWIERTDFAARAVMVLVALFIVLTGNSIPKQITTHACVNADEAGKQAFYRFAGWTWVLTGLAFGAAWIFLSQSAADLATLIVIPMGIALIVGRWAMVSQRPRSRQA